MPASQGCASRPRALLERRVAAAALGAAPIVVVLGLIAALLSPHVFAEDDSATGTDLWLGAAFGLAQFLVFLAVPQPLFGIALRSGTRRRLTATAIAAPLLAIFGGLLPAIGAITGGLDGVSGLAVVTSAGVGILDCFVFVIALRGVRRLGRHRSQQPG